MGWLRQLFSRRYRYHELSESIREHLEEKIADLTDHGMAREQAEQAARREFGNVTVIEERSREVWQWPTVESFWADLRYALRQLRKSPGFTFTGVITLALGIGANAAIFSLIDALFLKPLPLPQSERLLRIYAKGPSGHYGAGFSMPEVQNLREHTSSFSAVAAEDHFPQLNLVTSDGSSAVSGAFVSGNYFELLGIVPHLGRTFLPDEDAVPNRNAVVILSDDLWKVHFNSNPEVVGRQIQINGVKSTVIGVAPPGFHGAHKGLPEEVWIPIMMLGEAGYACPDATYNCSLIDTILGRLAPGVSATQAQAEIGSRMVWSASDWPERPSRRQVVLFPASSEWPDSEKESSAQMYLLMAVTGSLLLIACANLAGLLLARGAARKREISVRLAIGANRSRVVRQLLTESMLLSAVGGASGIGLSFAMKSLLSQFYATDSEGFQHLYDLRFDWRVLTYAVALTLVTGLLFGLLPALRGSRQHLTEELKHGGGSAESIGTRLRHALVICQVALSTVLVVSTVLLVRSGIRLQSGTNFDPADVIVLRLRPELLKYSPQQVQSLLLEAVRRISAAPGVRSVAFMEGGEGLVWNWQNGRDVQVAFASEKNKSLHSGLTVLKQDIGESLFATLRTPLLQGRDFNSQDRVESVRVAIVNEALALRLWLPGQAVGQNLIVDGKTLRVVGVVANLQPFNPLHSPEPHLYLSYWQSGASREGDIRMAVRVAGDPATALSAIRRIIRSVDLAVPLGEDMLMSEQVSLVYMPVLLARSVMSYCGLLAVCLGAIGLYSVLAFAVRTRTREIGIRMALGARREDVTHMILRQGMVLALVGVVVGVAAALLLTKLEASLLYGVRTTDPIIYASVAAMLLLCALGACVLPAHRAASIDPTEALRSE